MSQEKAILKFKDGSEITVDDLTELQKYAERKDLDSVSFFGGEQEKLEQAKIMPLMPVPHVAPPAALINASLTIDTDPKPETKTSIEQPKIDPNVPKPAPASDSLTTITVTISALAGAISPALANFAKSFINNKLRKKKDIDEDDDQPTDCKTHQIKSNLKLAKLSARIAAIENRSSQESKLFSGDSNQLEDLDQRIKKLEKIVKTKGKKL